MKKFRFIIAALLLIGFTNSAYSQKNLWMPTNIGIYGGLGINMYGPDEFRIERETSLGYYGGVIGNFPISNIFIISGRLGYNPLDVKLKTTNYDDNMNPISKGHSDCRFDYLEISPILQFHNLFPLRNIYLLTGLEFGIPLTLECDEYCNCLIGDTSITQLDVQIPNKSLRVALVLGAGYVIQVSRNVFLTPEASFRYAFTDISTDEDMDTEKVNQVRLGLSLTFDLFRRMEMNE
ncbi:MAG: outer membrane beta-barrel protein [Chloroherpetonaceae bacterium]